MDTPLLVVLTLLVVALLILVAIALLRKPQGLAELSASLQNLAQVQIELTRLSERVQSMEQGQTRVSQGIGALQTGLVETSTVARGLSETTSAIRDELARAKTDLTDLQARARARQDLEYQMAESVRRLEAVIAGTQTKGAAGENILEAVFANFPPDWQVRGFKVGNKIVEFGLRLPNNLVLPIDSKWPATDLLERLACCDSSDERQSLKGQIEKTVSEKAKEVTKYIDPNVTVNFGIAVVPDAVYDLCSSAQIDAYKNNVVLVSYSLFVPYLLLVFQTILKSSQTLDPQRLDAYLQSARDAIDHLQRELEGPIPDAITRLTNSRSRMAGQISKLSTGLVGLQVASVQAPSTLAALPEAPCEIQA
ncbi:MAG: DNA recombination protein RmuC [Chloroflexi bacterium]|nr:DNA recombination protein RmuC [Chloroflexota bacterium]